LGALSLSLTLRRKRGRFRRSNPRAGQRILVYEAPRCRKDGSEVSATITATPLFDDHNNYIGLVGLIIDNTDRFALVAKSQMFCSVVQNSPDFIGVADMNLNVGFVNRGRAGNVWARWR
jgi:PAS domain-containing protein